MALLPDPPPRALVFFDGPRRFAIAKLGPRGLSPSLAIWLLEEFAARDRFIRERLTSWYRAEHFSFGFADDAQILSRLLRDVELGWLYMYELSPSSTRVYTHRLPDNPRIPNSPPVNDKEDIVDTNRSLLITHCPPLFNPHHAPLPISYLLRELEGFPVELLIRSESNPEPPVHRRMLAPAATADGPGMIEWDGIDDASGELVRRAAAPFLVELVYDQTYRDQATTSLAAVALELRFIEFNGQTIAGLGVALDTGEPDPRAATSDPAGELRFEDIDADAVLRITGVDEVVWDTDPHRSPGRVEPVQARDDEHRSDVALDLAGVPSTSIEVEAGIPHCVVLERPVLRVVVPDVARFDHNSALLVPAPWTEERHPLAAIVHGLVALLDEPERWLMVIGHASAPGGAASNQKLSEHRADALRALVEDDGATWVEHARKRGSLRDVMAYLDYLGRRRGWSCASQVPIATIGTTETADSRASVSAFQAEYNQRFAANLADDGVCGKKTLAAIFAVLRDEFERWLAKLGASPAELPLERVRYAGYGATLAGRSGHGAEAEAADRFVDLILVEGVAPSTDIGPADLYETEVAWRLPFELPNEPDEWATGPFTIVSDLTPNEPADPELYRLSSDGGVLFERVLPDDGEVDSHGELILRFEALSTEHRYTLVVVAHNGRESVIFEGSSYAELHRPVPKG